MNKSPASSKRPPTPAQREAGRNYYRYKKTMLNFEALTRYDIKHLTAEEQKTLTALFDTYRSRVKLARKSFIACPRCHEALTGRPFRPARKGTISTYTPCDICGHAHCSIANLNTPKPPNRYMRYSCILAEAQLTVREKAPELFL